MQEMLTTYFNEQSNKVTNRITDIFNTPNFLTQSYLTKALLNNKKFLRFHKYYIEITDKPSYAFETNNFFHEFKKKYSLLGISNKFLDSLEGNKQLILDNLRDTPFTFYSNHFQEAEILQRNGRFKKDLGSFASKLLHTFHPAIFAPLDSNIKEILGLKKEGFYFSFLVISNSYSIWLNSNNNKEIIQQVKNTISEIANTHNLTDMKIIDTLLLQFALNKKKKLIKKGVYNKKNK